MDLHSLETLSLMHDMPLIACLCADLYLKWTIYLPFAQHDFRDFVKNEYLPGGGWVLTATRTRPTRCKSYWWTKLLGVTNLILTQLSCTACLFIWSPFYRQFELMFKWFKNSFGVSIPTESEPKMTLNLVKPHLFHKKHFLKRLCGIYVINTSEAWKEM